MRLRFESKLGKVGRTFALILLLVAVVGTLQAAPVGRRSHNSGANLQDTISQGLWDRIIVQPKGVNGFGHAKNNGSASYTEYNHFYLLAGQEHPFTLDYTNGDFNRPMSGEFQAFDMDTRAPLDSSQFQYSLMSPYREGSVWFSTSLVGRWVEVRARLNGEVDPSGSAFIYLTDLSSNFPPAGSFFARNSPFTGGYIPVVHVVTEFHRFDGTGYSITISASHVTSGGDPRSSMVLTMSDLHSVASGVPSSSFNVPPTATYDIIVPSGSTAVIHIDDSAYPGVDPSDITLPG